MLRLSWRGEHVDERQAPYLHLLSQTSPEPAASAWNAETQSAVADLRRSAVAVANA
jgi:hypothetical protein